MNLNRYNVQHFLSNINKSYDHWDKLLSLNDKKELYNYNRVWMTELNNTDIVFDEIKKDNAIELLLVNKQSDSKVYIDRNNFNINKNNEMTIYSNILFKSAYKEFNYAVNMEKEEISNNVLDLNEHKHKEREDDCNNHKSKKVKKVLDASSHTVNNEPIISFIAVNKVGCVDFIFYNHQSLDNNKKINDAKSSTNNDKNAIVNVKEIYSTPNIKEILENELNKNLIHCSDHLPLYTKLQLNH